MVGRRIAKDREREVKSDRRLQNKFNKAARYNKLVLPISILVLLTLSLFLPSILAGFDGPTKFWNVSFNLNESGVWNITLDASADWAFSVHTDTNRTINVTTPADVRRLEITDHSLDYSRQSLSPIEGTTSNAAMRATIYDPDGTSGLNVTAYICDLADYALCSDTGYTYAKNLTYLEPAQGTDEYYYTFNGTEDMPQFWKQGGTWKLYVKVTDGSSTDYNETDFEYATLMAVNISTNISLGGATPTLGQWNSGTDEYILTNWGNVNLSINWNATDMVGEQDTWFLNSTDFAIDDDNNYADDSTSLAMVYLNATNKTFEPASGLLRCTSDSCINENSTLSTYYHIAPPLGLKAGTYNTTIMVMLSQKS